MRNNGQQAKAVPVAHPITWFANVIRQALRGSVIFLNVQAENNTKEKL